jgi:hypothetical protein
MSLSSSDLIIVRYIGHSPYITDRTFAAPDAGKSRDRRSHDAHGDGAGRQGIDRAARSPSSRRRRSAIRATFWAALAVAATASIGALLGTTVA